MRTTQTMTVSLPPAMIKEFERVRKAESRTRSELVREALRYYFSMVLRFPAVEATKAELATIKRGREAFARGEYVTLEELINDLGHRRNKTRAKGPAKNSLKG